MDEYISIIGTIMIICISIYNLNTFKLRIREVLLMVILTYLSSAVVLTVNEFLAIVPAMIVPVLLLYKHNKSIVKSILVSVVSVLIGIVADYCVGYIFISFFQVNIDSIERNSLLYWKLILIEFVLVFLVSKFLGALINKKIKISNLKFNGKFGLLIVVCLMLTLTIFYTNIIFEAKYASGNEIIKINGILFFAYFMLLMIIMYILLRSITKELEFKNRQSQFDNLQLYTNNLEKLYSDMRAFRHDYINILSSIIGYIQDKDIDGLEKHFNEKILPLGMGMESNNFKIGLLKNIKVPEIKGILSSKLIRAQELGIDVFIDIIEPIEKLHIDIIDLSRCIGILLDNAIEAAEKCDKPVIKIAVIKKMNSVLIVVINSCEEDVPIYKIYQKGFSTKGKNRGLGLHNLKEIIGRYSNVSLDTIKENGEFKQLVQITENI